MYKEKKSVAGSTSNWKSKKGNAPKDIKKNIPTTKRAPSTRKGTRKLVAAK
jgi:hypothetical protein